MLSHKFHFAFFANNVTIYHRRLKIKQFHFPQFLLFYIRSRCIFGQKCVILLADQKWDDFRTVVNFQRKLVVFREKISDKLADILQSKIAHQIIFLQKFLLPGFLFDTCGYSSL